MVHLAYHISYSESWWFEQNSPTLFYLQNGSSRTVFWRPFVKRFALCCRTVVCPVCNVGVLRSNDWTDQGETWRAGRPRPWPHCVRWERRPLPQRGTPQFSAHICCRQMARWIKMPLSRKVGFDSSNIVLDGDPAPLPRKALNFRPTSIVPKWLNGSRCHLVWR